MNEELIKLIHNECTPEERLDIMRRMECDGELSREYNELAELDDELKSLFANAAKAEISLKRQDNGKVRIFRFASVTAGFAALAASVALVFVISEPSDRSAGEPGIQTHLAGTHSPSTSKDPFSDNRQYVASETHRLSPVEAQLAKQLASADFKGRLEVQSRAAAKAKINEILSAPYIPKIGRDIKPQTTTQEAIEMLLAEKPKNGETFYGFAPNLF